MFDRARGLRGLVNLGNTCFAAACLQSLAHTPPLAEFVLRESLEESASARGASEVAREFARVVRAIHKSDALTSSRDAHDPRAFVRALDARPPLDLFTDGDQHDSQEFLRFLLDALDEDLNAVTTPPAYFEEKDDFSEPESAKAARLWAKYRARTSGVVVDVFAGQLPERGDLPRVRQGVDVVRPLLGPQPPPAREEEEGGRRFVVVVVDDHAPERQREPPVAVRWASADPNGPTRPAR